MSLKRGDLSTLKATQVKTSVARGIRKQLAEDFPSLEPALDYIFGKKLSVSVASCKTKANLLQSGGLTWFFQASPKEPWLPTLRTLYKLPGLLPVVGVDRGAIPFVLKGAKIMCQGITSKGGKLPDADYDEGEIVAIVAEGKGDLPIAIGQLTMSTKQIKSANSGPCLDNLHHLGDGLWEFTATEVWAGAGAEAAAPLLQEQQEKRAAELGGPLIAHPKSGGRDQQQQQQQQQQTAVKRSASGKRIVVFDGEEVELTDSSDDDDEGGDDEGDEEGDEEGDDEDGDDEE